MATVETDEAERDPQALIGGTIVPGGPGGALWKEGERWLDWRQWLHASWW
jgi:hypothetical protein